MWWTMGTGFLMKLSMWNTPIPLVNACDSSRATPPQDM